MDKLSAAERVPSSGVTAEHRNRKTAAHSVRSSAGVLSPRRGLTPGPLLPILGRGSHDPLGRLSAPGSGFALQDEVSGTAAQLMDECYPDVSEWMWAGRYGVAYGTCAAAKP